jgi:hypothetical protein
VGHIDHHQHHHHQHPTMQVAMHEYLKITRRNQEMHSGEIKPHFSPSKSPHFKKNSHGSLPQLLLLAARSK